MSVNHPDHNAEIHDPEPLKTREEVVAHIRMINSIAAQDYTSYKELEKKGAFKKKPRRIILFCSDGRVDVSMFFSNPLERFRHPQLPMAGNRWIVSDDFKGYNNKVLLDKFYEEHETDLEGLFEYMFGKYLAEDPNYIIEIQSHSEAPESYHHGCGAHGSNTANAVAETAKLAYLISKWNPNVKIVRTHNYTSQVKIVPAYIFDQGAMDAQGSRIGIGELAKVAVGFDPNPSILSTDDKIKKPIIVKGKKNHFGIDTENHAEQTILISDTPLAHHGGGRQALRMSWNTDSRFMFDFIKILMGIIKSNYLKRNPGAPIILHFDIPDGEAIMHEDGGKTGMNRKIFAERSKILNLMHTDPQIQIMLEQGELLVVTTLTDPKTYKTQIYQ